MQSTRPDPQNHEVKSDTTLPSTVESHPFWGNKAAWINVLVSRGARKEQIEKFSIEQLQKANTILNHLSGNSPVAYLECIEDYLALGLPHPALFSHTLDPIDVPQRNILLAEAGKLGNLELAESIYDFEHKTQSSKSPPFLLLKLEDCAQQFVLSGNPEVIVWFIKNFLKPAISAEQKASILLMPAIALGNAAVLTQVAQDVMKQGDVSEFLKTSKQYHDNLLYRAALREREIYQLVRATYLELNFEEERLHELVTVGDFINGIANGDQPDFEWMSQANQDEPKLKCLKDYHVYLVVAIFQSANTNALAAVKVFFNHFFSQAWVTHASDNTWSASARFRHVVSLSPYSFKAKLAAYNDMAEEDQSNPELLTLFLLSTNNLAEFLHVYGMAFPLVSPENLQARNQTVPKSPLLHLLPESNLSCAEESKAIKENWVVELLYNHWSYHKKFAAAKWMNSKDAGPHRFEVTKEFLDKIINVTRMNDSTERRLDEWNHFLPPRATLDKLFHLEPTPTPNLRPGPR